MRRLALALLLGLAACGSERAADAHEDPNAVREDPDAVRGEPVEPPSAPVRGEPVEPPPASSGLPGAVRESPNAAREDANAGREDPNPIREDPKAVRGEPVEPPTKTPGPSTPVPSSPPPAPVRGEPVEPPPPAPQAARRVPEDLLTENGVYYGCNTPQDCEVKNVGNCCGYFPACVNKDSPTFPEKVKADCAAEGRSAICGFQEISACQCLEGRCAPIHGPGRGELQ